MRLLITILAAATLLPAMPATADIRVCLDARLVGRAGDFDNYEFSGRIQGTDPDLGYGYSVVAIDDVGAHWAQFGGSVRSSDGRPNGAVRFGVSNVSTYPLRFVVVRVLDRAAYDALRRRPTRAEALSADELALLPEISDRNACIFDLESDKPVSAECSCSQ